MLGLRTDSLRWAAGAYCAVLGALMLVAPHQFGSPVFGAFRPHVAWWGAAFLLAGAALLGAAALAPRRALVAASHLGAGGLLLALAWSFYSHTAWIGATNCLVLGLGIAITALAPPDPEPRPGTSSADLFAVLMGIDAASIGVLLLLSPGQFQTGAQYRLVLPYLVWCGLAFLVGGLATVYLQLRGGRPRTLVTLAHGLVAVMFLIWMALVSLGNRNWVSVVYFGGFGTLLVLLPWLRPHRPGLDAASLRTRLAVALALAAAVPLVVLTVLGTDFQQRAAQAQAFNEQRHLATTLAVSIGDYVKLHQAAVNAIGAQPRLHTLPAEEQQASLRALQAAYPDVASFNIYDATGRGIARSDSRPNLVATEFPEFLAARDSGAPARDFRVGYALERPVVVLAAPVREPDGKFAGMVSGVLEVAQFGALLGQVAADGDREAYLVDERGRIIAHSDPTRAPPFSDWSASPPVAALRAGPSASGALSYTARSDQQLAGYAQVPDLGWGVVVTSPAATALVTARFAGDLTVGLLLLAILLAAAVGLLTANWLAGPLGTLVRAVEQLAAGNSGAPLPRSQISEVARLASAVADLRDRLAVRTAERQRAEARVRALNADLEQRVAARTAELEAAIASLREEMAERQRAEAALRASEERFRLLAENAHDVIYRYRFLPTRGFEYVSPAVTRIIGYTPEEHYADPDLGRKIVHPDDLVVLAQMVDGSAEWSGPLVLRWLSKDGAVVWTEQRNVPTYDAAGRLLYIDGIARDVTERRQAEEQRQVLMRAEKLRALGQMASGVAHDLNQYLGLVVGHSDLALRSLNSGVRDLDGVRESLRIVTRAAMDGAETVKRLLTFARPYPDGPPERIDLSGLLDEVAKLTAPRWRGGAQAEGRPIQLYVEAEAGLAVDGWSESLREALTNLVFNAVDALPHGGVIRLTARRQGSRVAVEVADTGVGMTDAVQARVFEPFFTTKGERGTGLGLSMVYGIIERHGGQITLDSAPGRGTTFRLTFPGAASPAATPDATTRPATATALRILAVDDEPGLATMVAAMLTPEGHHVVTARSGEEALDRLAAESFDVVLSDVGMGDGMNGWELADRVQARYPAVAFALATGWGAQIDLAEARARGVQAVIAKPYRLADLRAVIATIAAARTTPATAPAPVDAAASASG